MIFDETNIFLKAEIMRVPLFLRLKVIHASDVPMSTLRGRQ